MQRVHWAWVVLLILVGILYIFGLNSPYAPTNGDEMVYIHIARMTAESGHWLPLQSEIAHMRNTKPPLLFWQAMVAGDWGQRWQLGVLRLPSVLYTFLTTGFIAFFTHRISKEWRTALIAASLYLLFFSTFRYGRVYLTSAPETFWLALPMWWLVWQGSAARWNALTYTFIGIAMGLGCLYKSFALAAPAAAALWCAVLFLQPWNPRTAARHTVGMAWSTVLAVAIFALWFALDPDPNAVWQEFVVGENGGKMSNAQGYWHNALSGEYPMWPQLLAYPINAGLLFLVVVGWILVGVRKTPSTAQPTSQRILLIWLAVWLVVFTIPSQRSERYLIPAMPALAILMALQWDKLPAWSFRATLIFLLPAFVIMGRVGWVTGDLGIASDTDIAIFMIAICAGLVCVTAGLSKKNYLRPAALWGVALVYASFSLMVQPLTEVNAQYQYPSDSPQIPRNMTRIAVPNGFTGQYERFHFIFPSANLTPYDTEGRNTGAFKSELPPDQRLSYLLGQFDAVVWYQNNAQESEPSCMPRCTVIGSRWHIKSRHKSGEVTFANIWHPEEWLFRQEWLIVPKYD